MPRNKSIVINTGPILSLFAAIGDLKILKKLYFNVCIPKEVCDEVEVGGETNFAVQEFKNCIFLKKEKKPLVLIPHLKNSLDLGEASVIQLALNKNINTVCIDEPVGRRIARLNDLNVTGSIGILLKLIELGYTISMRQAIENMRKKGIYLSDQVINFAFDKENKLKSS